MRKKRLAEKEAIQELARRLRSTESAEREQAETELRQIAEAENAYVKKINRVWMGYIYCYMVWMPLVIIMTLGTRDLPVWFSLPLLVSGLLIPYFTTLGILKHSSGKLSQIDDPRVIGPLAQVLASSSEFMSVKTRFHLQNLLLRLKASDSPYLLTHHLQYLYDFLEMYEGEHEEDSPWIWDMKVAILRALEQVGDESAIPYVQKLGNSSRSMEVMEAARDCLPALGQKAAKERISRRLLRASSSPDSQEHILVRPAHSNPTLNPDQLVRPVPAEEAET